MKTETFESTIPFSGFYHTLHSQEVDREIEMLPDNWYDTYQCDIPDWLMELAWDGANYQSAYQDYAKEYAASFCDWLGLDCEFVEMTSPRGYNFETDRIFVKFSREAVARMWRGVSRADFEKAVKARFTSRSGFISHYSNDWRDWGPISTWDHNQIGTLVGVFAETEQGGDFDHWAEYSLMEDYACNGGAHCALWQGERADRFWKVWNHLTYDRPGRAIKTVAQWYAANQKPWETTPLGQAAQ